MSIGPLDLSNCSDKQIQTLSCVHCGLGSLTRHTEVSREGWYGHRIGCLESAHPMHQRCYELFRLTRCPVTECSFERRLSFDAQPFVVPGEVGAATAACAAPSRADTSPTQEGEGEPWVTIKWTRSSYQEAMALGREYQSACQEYADALDKHEKAHERALNKHYTAYQQAIYEYHAKARAVESEYRAALAQYKLDEAAQLAQYESDLAAYRSAMADFDKLLETEYKPAKAAWDSARNLQLEYDRKSAERMEPESSEENKLAEEYLLAQRELQTCDFAIRAGLNLQAHEERKRLPEPTSESFFVEGELDFEDVYREAASAARVRPHLQATFTKRMRDFNDARANTAAKRAIVIAELGPRPPGPGLHPVYPEGPTHPRYPTLLTHPIRSPLPAQPTLSAFTFAGAPDPISPPSSIPSYALNSRRHVDFLCKRAFAVMAAGTLFSMPDQIPAIPNTVIFEFAKAAGADQLMASWSVYRTALSIAVFVWAISPFLPRLQLDLNVFKK